MSFAAGDARTGDGVKAPVQVFTPGRRGAAFLKQQPQFAGGGGPGLTPWLQGSFRGAPVG